MLSLIDNWAQAQDALTALVAAAEAGNAEDTIAPADAVIQAPVPDPRKNVFCVGRNYAEHIAGGRAGPKNRRSASPSTRYFSPSRRPRLCHRAETF